MSDLLALDLPGVTSIPDPIGEIKPNDLPLQGSGVIQSGQNIGAILAKLLPYVFGFAGLILFVMFIMAGFTLITAVGNKEKIAKGSAMMTSSIIGFVIIFVAFWIMQLLELILGISLGFGGNP